MAHSDTPQERDEIKRDLVRSSLEQARTSFHAYAEIANRLLIGHGGVVEVFNQKALDLAKHDAEINFIFALKILELDDLDEIILLQEEHKQQRAREMAQRVAELQALADQADMHLNVQELAEESSHKPTDEFPEEVTASYEPTSTDEVSAAAVSAIFRGQASDTAENLHLETPPLRSEPVEVVEVVEVETAVVAESPVVTSAEDLVEVVRAPEETAVVEVVSEPVTVQEPSVQETVEEVVTAEEVVFEPLAQPDVMAVEEKTVEAAAEAVPVLASQPEPEAAPEPEPEPVVAVQPEQKNKPEPEQVVAPVKDEAPVPSQPVVPVESAVPVPAPQPAPVKKPSVKLMPDSPDQFIEDEIKALSAKINRAKLVRPNVTSASDEDIARAIAEAEEVDEDLDLGSARSHSDYMDDLPGLENFVVEADFQKEEEATSAADAEEEDGSANSFSDDLAAQLEAVRAMIRG